MGCGGDDEPATPAATSTTTTERVRPRSQDRAPEQMRGVTADAEARAGVATTPSAGAGYEPAHLIFFHTQVHTPCGQDPAGANPRSIQVELQADCYAGIWLHAVAQSGQLSEADVQQLLTAAAVVGDDHQRNRAGAELAPEIWTHGSSQQRVHWVSVGKDSGDPADCDTFSGGPPRS